MAFCFALEASVIVDNVRLMRAWRRIRHATSGHLLCSLSLGLSLVAPVCFSPAALAEEGGSGHYQPGSMASFADSVSPVPAFIARLNALGYFNADFDRNISLPIGGVNALNVSADAKGIALTLAWVPEWGVLDDTWTYQVSATIPFMWLDVDGTVQVPTPLGILNVERSDSISALGDVVFQPLMLN